MFFSSHSLRAEFNSNIDHDFVFLVGPGSTVSPNKHKWKSEMKPFTRYLNAHGLSEHYTQYYYTYDQAYVIDINLFHMLSFTQEIEKKTKS